MRFRPNSLPQMSIETHKLFKRKGASPSRRHAPCKEGGLDRDRAAPTQRIKKGLCPIPSGQTQETGRQVLAKRSLDVRTAKAPLKKRFSRGIEVERDLCRIKKRIDSDIRSPRVHGGSRL